MHILSTKDRFLDSEKLISKYLNYNIVIVNTRGRFNITGEHVMDQR